MSSVVINADDYGYSDGICRAIWELLDANAISNTTIMIAANEARMRVRKWNGRRLLGFAGVHLQLTDGKPISPISEVPSLVNQHTGEFLPTAMVELMDSDEIRLEWNRQFETVSDILGGLPTHIDSHKGLHRMPKLTELYLDLALKYNIPVRGGLDEDFITKMNVVGVRGSTVIVRDWTGRSLGLTKLKELVLSASKAALDHDIIEVVCHPGYTDDYLEEISSLNRSREDDLRDIKQLKIEGWLESEKCNFVKYPEL